MTSGTGFNLVGNTIPTTTVSMTPSVPSFSLTNNPMGSPATPGLSFDAIKTPVTTAMAATGFSIATTTAGGGFSFGTPTTKPMTGIDNLLF